MLLGPSTRQAIHDSPFKWDFSHGNTTADGNTNAVCPSRHRKKAATKHPAILPFQGESAPLKGLDEYLHKHKHEGVGKRRAKYSLSMKTTKAVGRTLR